MNTAGTIQWPQRRMMLVIRRCLTSHDPTRHHNGTPAANTAMVNAVAVGLMVRNTGV